MSNLMRNEAVLVRRIDEFLDTANGIESEDGKKRISIFKHATCNVMGGNVLWRLLRIKIQGANEVSRLPEFIIRTSRLLS